MKLLEMNLRFTILVFMLYIFVSAYGKELQLRGTHALFKRNLYRQKRLSDFSEERNDVCSEDLKKTPKKPSIIKSSASIDNGARYINAKNGTTKVECFNMCCRDPECDTSLYQDKEKRRCYMFDCHDKCVFKEHAGYAITVLYRPKITPPPKEEEEELAQLHDVGDKSGTSSSSHDDDINDSDNEDRSNSDSGSSSSSSDGGSSSRPNDENDNRRMGPSARAHATKHVYVAPHTAGLSDNCESDVSCEDPNAGCFGQACHCKEGFYNKNGLCRKMCTQSDFECLALGTSGRGPECIPKSNMCDSVLQCADGSDEFNCPSQDSGSRNSNIPQQASSAWMTGQGAPMRNNNYDNSNYNNMASSSGRQIPVETQPVLQKGQNFQHKTLNSNVNINDKSSTAQENRYNTNNDIQPNANIQQQQGYDSDGVNPPYSSVRPMNSMVSQPAKLSMDDRNQLAAKSNNDHDNRHMQASLYNTANPKPTNNFVKATEGDNYNTNQNHGLNSAPSHSSTFTGSRQQQDTKSYSNSLGGQGSLSQPHQPDSGHTHESNYAKEPLTQHHNPSTNNAYSENRRPPLNRGRKLNLPGTQYKSQSSHSQFQDNSNMAPHASDISKIGQGRDGIKVSSSGSHQQRVPGPSENPLPSLPKSSSVPHTSDAKGVENKSHHDLVQPSKAKASSSHSKQGVGPNDYPSSLLSSSSSSRQQPNRQSWLDGNPYLSYGSGGSGNQRQRQQQMQPSRNNQFYDSPQYFPQYNTDSLDSLPPSLLRDTGSQDDFSAQFGGPYVDRQKPRMPYPMSGGGGGGGNSGYMGYQDSPYNSQSQYNPSGRFNYGGEFGGGAGTYQDSDFYPSLRNSNNKDYQSPGLYEDEQSSHQLPSSGIIKNKGTYQPGTKSSMREEIPSGIHKTESTVSSEKEEDTKASLTSIPKTDAPAPTSNQDSSSGESVKNKTKQNNEVGSVSISKTNLTHPSTKKPHPSHDHINSKVFVTKEKVIIASSTSEAEGPIIALSLGLAFTLILVALLGCRLRNMKHRLRKGRPLNSNEADYLINGMYL